MTSTICLGARFTMSHAEAAALKERLIGVPVTPFERIVLLDMAESVKSGTTVYKHGHNRLALAIGKRPGTAAAKQALSGRILPALLAKKLLAKISDAHPGYNAEYEILALREAVDNSPEMGNGQHVMGNGLSREWVTDSADMGNAQTVTPSKDTSTLSSEAAIAPHPVSSPPEPERACRRHPNGWDHDERCRTCGQDREAHERWAEQVTSLWRDELERQPRSLDALTPYERSQIDSYIRGYRDSIPANLIPAAERARAEREKEQAA
ncbi:hypothetical protein ACU045_12245 [Microbacterium sp. MAHUQ-60]|uniref:hypothetical protein n=1 Tax=unclassified Microbacterium TaxID=2609290 RepID=UPI00361EB924